MSHSKQKYSQSLKQSDQQMQHMRGFFGSSSKLLLCDPVILRLYTSALSNAVLSFP